MLRSLLLAMIFFSAPINLWAKEDFQKACQLQEEGKLQEALAQFQALNKAQPQNPGIIYGLASVQALLGNYSEAMNNLKIALNDDKDLRIFASLGMYRGSFTKLLDLSGWDEVEAIVNKNLPFENKALVIQLWRMHITDQAYAWDLIKELKEVGSDSPKVQAVVKRKHKLDRKNQRQMARIISKHGWPKRSEVGEVANAAFMVIQHSYYRLQRKYLPLLERACEKGEARWDNYALMYDRVKVHETGRQLYGTQLGKDGKSFEPIEDIEHLNERRLSKGLQPMEDYAAFWGIDWEKALLQMKQEQSQAK